MKTPQYIYGMVLVILFPMLCAAGFWFMWLRGNVRASLDRVDKFELHETFKQWTKAGQPRGRDLEKFMNGRGVNIVATNYPHVVKGTTFWVQFVVVKARSSRKDALCITTNGILILGNRFEKAEQNIENK